jgi:hypothetical protein
LVPKRTSLLALSKSLTVLFANEKSITPLEPILTASVSLGLKIISLSVCDDVVKFKWFVVFLNEPVEAI